MDVTKEMAEAVIAGPQRLGFQASLLLFIVILHDAVGAELDAGDDLDIANLFAVIRRRTLSAACRYFITTSIAPSYYLLSMTF